MPFKKLKVALISDELTRSCLVHECRIFNITPRNYKFIFKLRRPDIVLVESAWQGIYDSWKYKIAAYPDYPKRSNIALRKLVNYAKALGIPCVFWNKEDSVHFERFISSASLFDYIFTVDEGCIERYKNSINREVTVAPLMFAVQPGIHSFSGIGDRLIRANFVGSYSRHLHDIRQKRQDMLLSAAASSIGLTVFDRNSNRKSVNYRYPLLPDLETRKRVSHHATADIYKNFIVSLNFNTIDNSKTMFSRRLIEIIACGGLALSTPAQSINQYFKDYCYIVDSEGEAREILDRLKYGYSPIDLEMIHGGAEYIVANHTYRQWLQTILDVIR